ncbi:MAG: hypothetical protein BJ554DRAFT_7748, partial [Olpidium bornovanus]
MADRRHSDVTPGALRSPLLVTDSVFGPVPHRLEREPRHSPDRAYDRDADHEAYYRARRRSRSVENGRAYKRRRSYSPPYDAPRAPRDHMYLDSRRDPFFRRPPYSFPPEAYPAGPPPILDHAVSWNGAGIPREALEVADLTDLDYLLSYKEFSHYLEVMDGFVRPEEEMSRRYTIYKENFFAKEAKKFFDEHKAEEWFKDKYHPIDHRPFRAETFSRRHKLLPEFLRVLEQGTIDGISFDERTPAKDDKRKDLGLHNDEVTAAENPLNWMTEELSKRTLFIKTVPLSVSRKHIEEEVTRELGDRLDYISFSDPNPQKRFFRQAWIVVKDVTMMDDSYRTLEGMKVDDVVFHLSKPIEKKDIIRPRYAPESAGTERQLKVDLERIRTIAEILEREADFTDGIASRVLERAESVIAEAKAKETEETSPADKMNPTLEGLKIKVDMLSVYLRHVHMFCYYCGLESDSLEELNRKCGLHYRKRHGSEPVPKEKNWHKYHDGKLEVKILGADFAVEKIGGKNVA